jgi:hypothetical protein
MNIEITERIEVFSPEPLRVGKKDLWVTYIDTDTKRVSMVTLPAEGATTADIQKAIKAQEAERAKLVGHKFTI